MALAKLVTSGLVVAVLCLGTLPARAAVLLGSATLTGAQEVPANGSTATGTGSFSYDTLTNTLSDILVEVTGILTGQLAGNPPGFAHIHAAPAGSNGGIIVHLWEDGTLTPTATGFTLSLASAVLSDAQETALRAGGTYFNIHTVAFGGGEIRGQIAVTPVPAALPLLATALGGIGLLVARRRRR